jgi:hypothetical protein
MAQKRRKPYEGGEWAIGACRPYRPPHTLSALEAAAEAAEIRAHWLPFAEARAAEGRRWYGGIVAWYERELTELDAVIAAQATPQKRARRQRAA